jgi:hypothetical protein
MNGLLVEIILPARNNGIEGWMQMLVLVLVVLFYALGSILKSRAKQPETDAEEQLTRKPPGKPLERGRGLQRRFAQQVERTPFGGPARRPRRPQPAQPTTEPPATDLVTEKVTTEKELPLGPLTPLGEPGGELPLELLLDYADPEELRRAILHYEILGKPLSMRGPSEQIIGL